MLPRERVITVINHGQPDRIPIYGWVRINIEEQINARFGSVEALEDRYEFDYAHIFGGPRCWDGDALGALREAVELWLTNARELGLLAEVRPTLRSKERYATPLEVAV